MCLGYARVPGIPGSWVLPGPGYTRLARMYAVWVVWAGSGCWFQLVFSGASQPHLDGGLGPAQASTLAHMGTNIGAGACGITCESVALVFERQVR